MTQSIGRFSLPPADSLHVLIRRVALDRSLERNGARHQTPVPARVPSTARYRSMRPTARGRRAALRTHACVHERAKPPNCHLVLVQDEGAHGRRVAHARVQPVGCHVVAPVVHPTRDCRCGRTAVVAPARAAGRREFHAARRVFHRVAARITEDGSARGRGRARAAEALSPAREAVGTFCRATDLAILEACVVGARRKSRYDRRDDNLLHRHSYFTPCARSKKHIRSQTWQLGFLR